MTRYVIGIDPDSKAHGVAVYEYGKLIELRCMTLMELMDYISSIDEKIDFGEWIDVHIENVCSLSAVYRDRMAARGNAAVHRKMSNSVGRCQQAQVEVERMIKDMLGEKRITRHKPSRKWKDAQGKKQFEKITGWKGRSNEDTRSAAYFGYLGL